MKRLILLTLAIAGTAASAAPLQADVAKGKEIASKVCLACHGADGNSAVPMYPSVASQHADYIFRQTLDIKEGKRTTGASASMAAMIANLSEQDILDVSAFYAKQAGKSGEADPSLNPQLGEKIFRGGLVEKKIPACMSCHSPNGAGMKAGGTDVTAYPRLAGQHSDYTLTQLKAYASEQRKSANAMMEDIAKRMSEEEMKAVATYLQGLH